MTPTPSDAPRPSRLSRRQVVLTASAAAATAAVMSGTAVRAGGQESRTAGKRLLLINAHQTYPGISEGRLNRSAVDFIRSEMAARGFEIRETAIEAGYDVAQEVRNHLWADVVIVQTPAYWISTPWIYKKYIDEIFTAGMIDQSFLSGDGRPAGQYGSGGKLQGRKHMVSLTMNAPREAFDDPAQALFGGRSIDEVFFPASAPYRFCGMEILPAFAFQDVISKPDVANDFTRLKAHLTRHFGA